MGAPRTAGSSMVAILAFVSLLLLSARSAQAQTQIDTCGRSVDDGVLIADLVGCETAVTVRRGGRLHLAGHTISTAQIGILCEGKCTILGPGTIADSGGGVRALGRLTVENVSIVRSPRYAIYANESVRVFDSVFTDNAHGGLGFAIDGTGERGGLSRITLRSSTMTGNYAGLVAKKAHLRDSEISTCTGTAIHAFHGARLRDSVLADNGTFGIEFIRTVKLIDSSVTGSGQAGMGVDDNEFSSICSGLPLKAKLTRSTATGNGTLPDCGTGFACGDIVGCRAKLKDSTCDSSYRLGSGLPGQSLGVCTSD